MALLSPCECGLVQLAASRKYDVNLTWQFAEIRPGLFALYNPIRRELVALGTIEEVLQHYRAREPFVPVQRQELSRNRRIPPAFHNIKVNI
jgi:hypothetical protein